MKMNDIQPYTFKTGLALFSGLLLGQIFIGVLIAFFKHVLNVDLQSLPIFFIVGYTLTMIPPIIIYYCFIVKPNASKLTFNLSSSPFSVYLMVFPMMFGMMLMVEYIVSFIPTTGFFFGIAYEMYTNQLNNLATNNITMIISTVILAPILEEVIFRGVLQKSIINSGKKPMMAIVISSLIFGAIHGYPWQFVGGFFLSLVLGLVYEKTQSLLIPILLHAFNNLISALMFMSGNFEGLHNTLGLSSIISFIVGLFLFGITIYMYVIRKAIIFGK